MVVVLLVAASPALASTQAAELQTQESSTCFYTPTYGETLTAIAQRYGTTVQTLAAMNGLANPNRIVSGVTLVVPCTGGSSEGENGTASGGVCATYAVRRGGSLDVVAWRYGSSWQAIAQANRLLHPGLIYPGQRLAIPCGPGQTGSAGQGGSYVSSTYGYAIKYSAGWTVSVSNPPTAGVGRNPEYVRFQPTAGGLPDVQILALTGAAPMTGREDCQPNVSFAGMKTCKIEQPAGQNPATDLWVFQRGDAHFLISVAYEDAAGRAAGTGLVETFDFTR